MTTQWKKGYRNTWKTPGERHVIINLTWDGHLETSFNSLVKEEQLCHLDDCSSPSVSLSCLYSQPSVLRAAGEILENKTLIMSLWSKPVGATPWSLRGPPRTCIPALFDFISYLTSLTPLASLLVPRQLSCPPASTSVHWTGLPRVAPRAIRTFWGLWAHVNLLDNSSQSPCMNRCPLLDSHFFLSFFIFLWHDTLICSLKHLLSSLWKVDSWGKGLQAVHGCIPHPWFRADVH